MFFLSDDPLFSDEELFLLCAASGGKTVEDTATGNPLTFTTDLAKPLESLLVPFLPVQSGTGDPSPVNVRPLVPWNGLTVWNGGKNLLNPATLEQGGINTDGVAVSNPKRIRTGYIPVKENTYYCLSAGEAYKAFLHFYDKDKGSIGGNTIAKSKAPAGACFVRGIIGYQDETNIVPADCTTGQLEVVAQSGQATEYEPYKPITETDIVFPAMGNNLGTFVNGKGIDQSGNVYDEGQRCATVNPIPIKQGESYIFTAENGANGIIAVWNGDTLVRRSAGIASGTKINTDGGDKLYVCIYKSGETCTVQGNNPQVRTSSVYGGTLDVVSGVLTDGFVKRLLDDSDAWTESDSFFTYSGHDMSDRKTGESYGFYCTAFPAVQKSTGTAYIRWGGTTAFNLLIAKNGSSLTLAELKELSTSGDLAICYELATPQEITLTPEQITALVGDNTIWSDADGSMTAVYLKKG